MKRSLTFGAAITALAPIFNRLLGLDGTEYVGSGRSTGPSPGNLRAAAELARHRARFEDMPDTSVWTRQRRRQAERRAAKGRAA